MEQYVPPSYFLESRNTVLKNYYAISKPKPIIHILVPPPYHWKTILSLWLLIQLSEMVVLLWTKLPILTDTSQNFKSTYMYLAGRCLALYSASTKSS